jgi:hypothetical protein
MDKRDGDAVYISETVIVLIVLVVLAAFLLWSFFDAWGPVLRQMR